MTRIPGGALPSGNQNVCRPVESARAVFSRLPVSKCTTTVILAPGAVTTETPTLVPVRGCFRVTVAVPVSGGRRGEAAGAGDGVGKLEEDAGIVPALAAGLGSGDPTAAPIAPRTTKTPPALMIAVHTLWRAGQLL